jgi:hypothetical protein
MPITADQLYWDAAMHYYVSMATCRRHLHPTIIAVLVLYWTVEETRSNSHARSHAIRETPSVATAMLRFVLVTLPGHTWHEALGISPGRPISD